MGNGRMDAVRKRLLAADEPDPVAVRRPHGRSPFFLTCDHAGRLLPRALGDLGVPAAKYERHIAWDTGAAAASRLVSKALDASLVEQVYSRLVIDCNRDPSAAKPCRKSASSRPFPAMSRCRRRRRRSGARRSSSPITPGSQPCSTPTQKRAWRRSSSPCIPHTDLQGRGAALACRGPLQSRPVPGAHPARPVQGRRRPRGRRQRAYHISDETDYGIPVHGSSMASGAASPRRDRDSAGPHRRRGWPGGLGGTHGPSAARRPRAASVHAWLLRICR